VDTSNPAYKKAFFLKPLSDMPRVGLNAPVGLIDFLREK
jgi:hypothetical protein